MKSNSSRGALGVLIAMAAVSLPAMAENSQMPMMPEGGHQMMDHGMMQGSGAMLESRLAYVKAELGINDAQSAAWESYATAVKARGVDMHSMHATMMQAMRAGTAIERMNAHTMAMQNMLEAMKTLKPATEALYKVLDDSQKKKADSLLGGDCGMM